MKFKYLKLYLLIILPLLAVILFFLLQGKTLLSPSHLPAIKNPSASTEGISESFRHPFSILLMQMFVVLAVAKLFGYLFKKIGQQSVIGEIVAGIMLGPSLFGFFMPGTFQFIFPVASLPYLELLSQIGVLLFMFIIGMELDIELLKKRAREAIVISHVSIVFPYLLGVILAFFLYSSFAPAHIPFVAYALFMGIAMSITAFPVLARILKERNMTREPVGRMAIICAAIDDVTAWCILAMVIAIAKAGGISEAMATIVLAGAYVAFMFFVARPLLKRLSKRFFIKGDLQATFIIIVFLTLLFSAWMAMIIGIHALFGAFLAGVIMPQDLSLRKLFTERVEDVSVMLLLPLFFAFTGLRTHIGLLNTATDWLICAFIIVFAVIGKVAGSAIAAKMAGQSWQDSLSIGVLMNTRGLMELIVLNIGYDLGILSPEIFTMMVIMALVTTLMTNPALNLIERVSKRKRYQPLKAG
jgi:Kef-type K+ transport system membrane component KefB